MPPLSSPLRRRRRSDRADAASRERDVDDGTGCPPPAAWRLRALAADAAERGAEDILVPESVLRLVVPALHAELHEQ